MKRSSLQRQHSLLMVHSTLPPSSSPRPHLGEVPSPLTPSRVLRIGEVPSPLTPSRVLRIGEVPTHMMQNSSWPSHASLMMSKQLGQTLIHGMRGLNSWGASSAIR